MKANDVLKALARQLTYIVPIVIAFLAIDLYIDKVHSQKKPVHVNLPAAPDFTLPQLQPDGVLGEAWSLAAQRGTPVVVNFWASWCTACIDEKPYLDVLWGDRDKLSITVVGIATSDDLTALHRTGRAKDGSFPVLFDADGAVAKAFQVDQLPQTFVIAPDGRILFHVKGPVTDRNALGELRKMLSPEVVAVYGS